ncbi:glycosyl hydrolase 53 family protein [Catenibacterium mitsuokai]|uniref:glycosyl hydrolase 53 family protein n=1 Tax=Catenibacterium mitsuokai TaxID=100886 RepID=UPI0018ABDAAB|nr:glycosyl hydrolase 53 family protein [Catenibacterium mitsuokai]
MNKKLITSFVSAALVCSMGMSGVSAVTPVPTMHNNNQVTAASMSRSIADYKKIEGINDQTVLGADFTHYQQDLEWGKTYYNYKSVKIDNLFKFVQGQGINTISVKVAVNPDTSSDKTKCYTLDSAIKTIKAAKEAGLKTNITLFYSDDVTYANSQQLPAGWTQDNAVEKATDYTKEVLDTLSKNDALPTMMTIGNEVNYNFLGLTEGGGWDGFVAMATISKLINEKGVKTALSFAAPDDAEGIQYVIEKLGYAGVDYSYLGVNLYADRNGINDYVKTLRTTVKEKAADKQLIVSNIKFPRQNADETASTETQAESIYNLLSASISDSNAGGLIYDEAEYVGSWNGFFNEQGLAQTSLAVFGFAQGWNIDIDSYRDPYEYGDDTGLKEKKVTINKISNMSESTIRGVDVGSYVALTNAGVDVGMVQVGNEITKGMAGIHNKDSNNSVWKNESQYSVLDRYLNAGSKAVREILPDALVTLHIETPNRQIYSMIMDAWEKGNVDYDVLGSSYYPFWWNTPDMLRDVQTLAKERGKLFAVMETAWVNSYEDGDGTPNSIGSDYGLYQYEIGPQGQVDELTDMYKVLTEQDNGLGGFYWEPGWIPVKAGWTNWKYNKEVADKYGTGWASKGAVGYAPDDEMYYNGQPLWGGSSWDNATLFDIQGNALQSLKFYKDSVSLGKVQTTRINIVNKEKEVLKTEYVNVNVGDTKTITLPKVDGYYASKGNYNYTVKGDTDGVKTVTVTYNHSTEANLVYVDGDWYLMQDGQVVHETTLAQVNGTGTWYYVEDGKLNWNYTGLVKYYSTWYYVQNGVLD